MISNDTLPSFLFLKIEALSLGSEETLDRALDYPFVRTVSRQLLIGARTESQNDENSGVYEIGLF